MSRVFVDTNFLIYAFEGRGSHAERCQVILDALESRKDVIFTSTLVFAEVLVKPTSEMNLALLEDYDKFFKSGVITTLSFREEEAKAFAEIRANTRVSPPDAINLACAAVAGTDLFISSDISLTKKKVPGIHFICTPDTAPL